MSENQAVDRPGTKHLRTALIGLPLGVLLFVAGFGLGQAESRVLGLIAGLVSLLGLALFAWGVVSLSRGIWKRIA